MIFDYSPYLPRAERRAMLLCFARGKKSGFVIEALKTVLNSDVYDEQTALRIVDDEEWIVDEMQRAREQEREAALKEKMKKPEKPTRKPRARKNTAPAVIQRIL